MTSHGAPLTRVGGPDGRGAFLTVGAIALGLVVALVKPWGGAPSNALDPGGPTAPGLAIDGAAAAGRAGVSGGPTVPGGRSGSAAVASVNGAPSAPSSTASSTCRAASGWRVLAVGTLADLHVETWLPVAPVAATSPEDPTIPFVTVHVTDIERLGYCAGVPDAGGAALETAAWQLPTGGRLPVLALRHRADGAELSASFEGGLFEPPGPGGNGGGGGRTWAAGRYVFSVRWGPAPDTVAWFGADLVAPAGRPALVAGAGPNRAVGDGPAESRPVTGP